MKKRNRIRTVSFLLIAIGLVVVIMGAGTAAIPQMATVTVEAFGVKASASDVPAYSALWVVSGLAIVGIGAALFLKSR